MSETKFICGGGGNEWYKWGDTWINNSPEGWEAFADLTRFHMIIIKGIVTFLCFGLGAAPFWGILIGAMTLACIFFKKISWLIDIIFVIGGIVIIYLWASSNP